MPDSQNEDNLKTAEALVKDGKAQEAIPIFEETLANLEMLYGEEGLELADCLLGLGLAYEKAARLNDSLRIYTRALRLARKLLGQSDEVVVNILIKLIDVNEALGRPADALLYCEQAMTEARECLPKNSPVTKKITDRYYHFANLAGRREQTMPVPGGAPPPQPPKTGDRPDLNKAGRAETGEGGLAGAPSTEGSQDPEAISAARPASRRPAAAPIKASRGRSMPEGGSKQATAFRFLRDFSLPAIGVVTVLALLGFFVMHPPSLTTTQSGLLLKNAAAGIIDNLYRTADDSKKLRLNGKNEAVMATGGNATLVPYMVTSPDCQGLLPALAASLFEKQIWMEKTPSQMKGEDGITYYAADGPEAIVIAKMARLAGNAQGYFLRTGEFPKAVTPDMTVQYSYQNPLDGNETPVSIKAIIDDGSGQDNTLANLEGGNLITGEPPYTPCKIACYAVQAPAVSGASKRLKTIKFFVRGSDRDGKFISAPPPKKVFVISPSDAYLNAPEPPSRPAAGSTRAGQTAKGAAAKSKRPDLSLSVAATFIPPAKKTRMWIVSNPPCPLIYIHFGLPLLLFGLSIFTFLWSRMTGSDMRGRTTATGNNFAYILSAIFLSLTVLALAVEILIYG